MKSGDKNANDLSNWKFVMLITAVLIIDFTASVVGSQTSKTFSFGFCDCFKKKNEREEQKNIFTRREQENALQRDVRLGDTLS